MIPTQDRGRKVTIRIPCVLEMTGRVDRKNTDAARREAERVASKIVKGHGTRESPAMSGFWPEHLMHGAQLTVCAGSQVNAIEVEVE